MLKIGKMLLQRCKEERGLIEKFRVFFGIIFPKNTQNHATYHTILYYKKFVISILSNNLHFQKSKNIIFLNNNTRQTIFIPQLIQEFFALATVLSNLYSTFSLIRVFFGKYEKKSLDDSSFFFTPLDIQQIAKIKNIQNI